MFLLMPLYHLTGADRLVLHTSVKGALNLCFRKAYMEKEPFYASVQLPFGPILGMKLVLVLYLCNIRPNFLKITVPKMLKGRKKKKTHLFLP